MKKIFIIISLILISCKDSKLEKSNNSFGNTSIENAKNTCEDIIYQIIKSSKLDLRGQNDFLTKIDRIEDDNVTIQVYIENNVSEDPKVKQIVESTIAWLVLNVNDRKLYNTSADPDNPIEVEFDKNILSQNDIFNLCQIEKKEVKKDLSNEKIRYSILPIEFDEYYKACVNPYDSIKCDNNYPKYFFKEDNAIAKVFGNNFHPSDYMYLPKIKDYQPMILCNTDSDIESYDLVVVSDNKVISSLEIGLMDGESITQFNISKDYIISLYKRKNTTEKKVFFKSYIIDDIGSIIDKK
ncbi:hypothetical protein L1276_000613 [Flavobacterium sp. HSC-32F16]|uniref:hypothetical protein n=1 Tax=Flavobacterium sp. HSC-32F16 TaxID=2910964 RepID=UPI0020A2D418|nr:hypothetical protein [Flavobacterium sp. HSC-32F16]MCP2025473.1 hypothetical protein [Flavobacterium sp. HSC-32F16]